MNFLFFKSFLARLEPEIASSGVCIKKLSSSSSSASIKRNQNIKSTHSEGEGEEEKENICSNPKHFSRKAGGPPLFQNCGGPPAILENHPMGTDAWNFGPFLRG